MCFNCSQKASIARSKARKKLKEPKEAKKYENLEPFYKQVWEMQHKVCYESGQQLYNYHNWHVHHLLEKKHYPEYKLNPDVCVLLTLEQHSKWHTLPPSELETKMPKCWAKLQELKQKYQI